MKSRIKNRLSREEVSELSHFDLVGYVGIPIYHPGGLRATIELAETCHLREEQWVLDVGCGTGATVSHLADRYECNVVGIDMSELMLWRSRERTEGKPEGRRVRIVRSDGQHLPFRDNFFDVVMTESVLQIFDIGRALGEFSRVLRKGGHIGVIEFTWLDGSSSELSGKVQELTGLRFETLDCNGWREQFINSGLEEVYLRIYKMRGIDFFEILRTERLNVLRVLSRYFSLDSDSRNNLRELVVAILTSEELGYGVCCWRKI